LTQLVLIRGLPGSGKSTLARLFEVLGYCCQEADWYRTTPEGVYQYDRKDNERVHRLCLNETKILLDKGQRVVVANTFIRLWELQPYLDLGYPTTVLQTEGNYGNTHGVPEEVIATMRMKYEPY